MDETEYYNRRVGTTLQGKWTLERLLGAGGMAAVYVGVHRIGRRDAIKILHPEVAANPEVRGRFEQEAHAVNRLRHPGAVEVRDFDVTDDGCPFLVMELLEGETLSTRLERDAASLPELLQWTDELLEVLGAAHDLGIIHRDIKPDNLFVQLDGRLKVLDFGIARMREGAPRAMVTRTGTALGTLSYMPPEQARGIHIDGRADLYSVGATLFRALARRRLHDGQSDADVLIKVATTPAPMLSAVAPNVPHIVCAVVDCALSFQREHRYPDARTMQADVRAVARHDNPPYATEHPPPLRLESGPLSAASPPASGAGSDESTRAEGSGARRSQPMAHAVTEPAATRIEAPSQARAAEIARTLDATPPPMIAASAAVVVPPAPAQAQPPAPAKRTGAGPIIAAVIGVVVLLAVLAVAAIAWWWTSASATTEDASDAGVGPNSTEPPESTQTDSPPTPVAPTTTQRRLPPVATVPAPPGATGAAPPTKSAAPPTNTTPPTGTSPPAVTPPKTPASGGPPGTTKPPDPGKDRDKDKKKPPKDK